MSIRCIAGLALCAFAASAQPQAFPSKPLRLIIPTSAGALNDLFTRTVSAAVSDSIRQPIVIENRPGAGSIIGATQCGKAPPDGYTICVTTPEPLVLNPNLFNSLPYDPDADFTPVILLARTAGIIIASGAAPFGSFPELVAYAKANPGKLNYGTWGAGSVPAVFLEWIRRQHGIDITAVPYKGAAPTTPAILANEVQLTYIAVGPVMGHFKAGRLKPIAVTDPVRSSFVPDVPTLAEYKSSPGLNTWFALFAPGRTPPAVVDRLNAEFAKALATPKLREFMKQQTLEPVANSAAEFAAMLKDEKANAARIYRTLGIKPADAPPS